MKVSCWFRARYSLIESLMICLEHLGEVVGIALEAVHTAVHFESLFSSGAVWEIDTCSDGASFVF